MRYVLAKAKVNAEVNAYRIYVTDSLFFIAQGKAPNMRFSEFLNQQKPDGGDDRDAEEIITSMKDKLERLVNK